MINYMLLLNLHVFLKELMKEFLKNHKQGVVLFLPLYLFDFISSTVLNIASKQSL